MEEIQTWQVLGEDEVQYGPYPVEELMAFARDGTISRNSMVWTVGMEEWIPAGQVDGLFPVEVDVPVAAAPQRPQFVLSGQPRQAPFAQSKGVVCKAVPSAAPEVEIDWSFSRIVTGLRLVYWGFLINFLAALGHTVVEHLQEGDSSVTGGSLSGVATVLLLVALVSYITEFAGVCMCFKAPRDSKGRGFLVAAMVIMVMPFIGVLSLLLSPTGLILVPIGWALYPLAVLFHVLYMKRLAMLVGMRLLELRAKSFASYLMFMFGLTLLGMIMLVLAITGAVSGSGEGLIIAGLIGGIGAVALLVMAIVTLFLYIGLLRAFFEGIQIEILRGKLGANQATALSPG